MKLQNILQLNRENIILAIAIVVLLVGSIFFATRNFIQAQEINKLQLEIAQQKTNGKITNFLNLFIQKVLKTDKEISFEDRLKLENAIRDINNPEILSKWEQFIGGTNEGEIQAGVKNLLEILVKKIY